MRAVQALWRSRLREDMGGIAVYTAIVAIALLGIIGLALDGAGKLRATERADAVAMEAAPRGRPGHRPRRRSRRRSLAR
ncbi:hypothetical protein [Streptomyces sp. KCTC 0041BP]|uniref:hypothetical protein n=1 Tax=Streptomyces sp. KCTC 0041BP TaxID=201500 RepID=UPI0032AF64AF